MDMQQSWPGTIRRFLRIRTIARWGVAKLPSLRRAIRRSRNSGRCDLQPDRAVPELGNRSRMAGTVCVHCAAIRGALFRSDPAGTVAPRQHFPVARLHLVAEKRGCRPGLLHDKCLVQINLPPPQKKNPALIGPGSKHLTAWRTSYMAVLSVQETLLGGLGTITALTTPFETILVDGNHGGENPPCAKRRSK